MRSTLAIIFSFIFAIPLSIYSQSLSDVNPQLFSKIQFEIKNDNFENAEKLLKTGLQNSNDKIPLWIELGKLKVLQKKWHDARGWFDKVEDKDPENILAFYYLGMCNREIGKFQATLFRMLSLKASQKYFNKVIENDSTFLDVFYQYGLLHHLRKAYEKAIQAAVLQVKLKPELDDAIMGMFFLYRSFLLHKNSDQVEQWLLNDKAIYSQFFLAELYRQNSFFLQADSIYQSISNSNSHILQTPTKLAMVRSRLSNGSPLEAEMIYWQTVSSVKDFIDARFIFEDLKYICVDEEIRNYRSQKSPSAYKDYFKKFWLSRDPLPASPDNLRLIEHYRRLILAEKDFRFDGYRTWNANPDQQGFLEYPKAFYLNRDLNDKGLVYVRHGNPDDKATALGEAMVYNESWLYNEKDGLPKLIFHFEIDEDGLAGDWRLTPMLRDEAAINSVVMWDEAYARYLRGNDNMKNRIANEIAIVNKEQVRIAMATDRHTWNAPVENLPVYFSMANFKGQDDMDLCELYVSFPTENIGLDTSSVKTVNMGIVIHDKNWNEISKSDDYFQLDKNSPKVYHSQFVQTYQFELFPQSYRIAMHIDLLDSPKLGGFKFNVTLPYYHNKSLLCSDLMMAFDITANDHTQSMSKSNMTFRPNPSKQFKSNSPLYVYFEIYNLTKNNNGQTDYTVNYQVTDSKNSNSGGFLRLFGRKKSSKISIESDRSGNQIDGPEFTILDISSLNTGLKKLTINVQDNISGTSSTIVSNFEILEEKQ